MKESPISFTLCVLIIAALLSIGIYWLEERHYDGIIKEMDATIKAKEATIATLNSQLSGANRDNDKLIKENEDIKVYRGKDAPPLKKNAVILAAQMHEFLHKWKRNPQDPNSEWQYVNRFDERFWPRIKLVRDDLDQNNEQSDVLDNIMHDWVFYAKKGYDQSKTMADEIERLANKLPD